MTGTCHHCLHLHTSLLHHSAVCLFCMKLFAEHHLGWVGVGVVTVEHGHTTIDFPATPRHCWPARLYFFCRQEPQLFPSPTPPLPGTWCCTCAYFPLYPTLPPWGLALSWRNRKEQNSPSLPFPNFWCLACCHCLPPHPTPTPTRVDGRLSPILKPRLPLPIYRRLGTHRIPQP